MLVVKTEIQVFSFYSILYELVSSQAHGSRNLWMKSRQNVNKSKAQDWYKVVEKSKGFSLKPNPPTCRPNSQYTQHEIRIGFVSDFPPNIFFGETT